MFLENLGTPKDHKGWVEVICGSMFSGKTEELIRRVNRAQIANQKVEIFKPKVDKRYHTSKIVSHNQSTIPSIPVSHSSEIIVKSEHVQVVGIDEAQFLDDELVDVVEELANVGIRVIVAGLDMDFKGEPFGPMPLLLSKAEYITKLHAICTDCGDLANHSFRRGTDSRQVLLGQLETYKPLCRSCYQSALTSNS